TLTSTRSVSTISSARSNGNVQSFCFLIQFIFSSPLKYDESPQVDQPSSFDILDFCYALLSKH
ncbi:unnamed protein product, partial [Rotaria magnacalcarata]